MGSTLTALPSMAHACFTTCGTYPSLWAWAPLGVSWGPCSSKSMSRLPSSDMFLFLSGESGRALLSGHVQTPGIHVSWVGILHATCFWHAEHCCLAIIRFIRTIYLCKLNGNQPCNMFLACTTWLSNSSGPGAFTFIYVRMESLMPHVLGMQSSVVWSMSNCQIQHVHSHVRQVGVTHATSSRHVSE